MLCDVDTHIGRSIRRRRRLLGLTQQVVADRLGIAHQLLQKYETGTCRVSAARLFQVAKALEQPVAAFFPMEAGQ